jgi:Tol biopolymer transport system component
LEPYINTQGAYQSYLSISADGKVLYFSSERPEGLGKLDIYKSEMQADGNWGPAINLGPTINTKEDDDSPFISRDGKNLYFASKGHPGYGEYDLFKCTLNETTWGAPQNMGPVFNSSSDDAHLSFNEDETSGVFASAKAGGFGDMDIYEIKLKLPFEDFEQDALARISINLPDTVYVNEVTSFGVFSTKLPPSSFKKYYWQVADST